MASFAQQQQAARLGPGASWNARAGKFNHQRCAGRTCSNDAGYLGLPFCEACAMALWVIIDEGASDSAKSSARDESFAEYAARRDAADAKAREQEAKSAEESRRERMTKPGTIYYLRMDSLVKIGYSSNMAGRLRQYPPNAELLACHPGTRETERDMHNKFAPQLAKGREWFTPSDALNRHIAEVRESFPQHEWQTTVPARAARGKRAWSRIV